MGTEGQCDVPLSPTPNNVVLITLVISMLRSSAILYYPRRFPLNVVYLLELMLKKVGLIFQTFGEKLV